MAESASSVSRNGSVSMVALDDISLTIEDGTFTSVFGPPGSGKSVLLRILLGPLLRRTGAGS